MCHDGTLALPGFSHTVFMRNGISAADLFGEKGWFDFDSNSSRSVHAQGRDTRALAHGRSLGEYPFSLSQEVRQRSETSASHGIRHTQDARPCINMKAFVVSDAPLMGGECFREALGGG
jgi:hypothetical protein